MSRHFIAFIVGTKNEQQVCEFINEHYEEVSVFKILATDTEGKLLESSVAKREPRLEVQYVPSLEKRGDTEIANRAQRGQICAIFIINPPAIAKQFSPDRLAKIFDSAWISDTHVCVNLSNMEHTISHLASLKTGGIGKGGKKKRTGALSKAMLQVILTRFPTFDISLDPLEIARRDKVHQWAAQQLAFWFETNNLSFLAGLFPEEKYRQFITPETKYFALNTDESEVKNFVKLKACPLEESYGYLTIGPGALLREIWEYSKFERDFLICHHLFTTSTELLTSLRKWYLKPTPTTNSEDDPTSKPPSMTVITVLKDWILMEYGSDFADNEELCTLFEDFMKNDVSKDNPDEAKELTAMLNTALRLSPPYPVNLSKAPRPILPKKNKLGTYDFMSFANVEVARQMTLMDEQLFHKVRAKEFLGGAWTKKDSKAKAPNLHKFIEHTNRMAAWVVTEILKLTEQEQIAEMITKFIRIGKELLEMRNYAGVMNVLTALHSGSIGRLKNAWNLVPKKEIADFDQLTEELSLLGHYKKYRETLKSLPASTPCIPLIPVTCSDLNGLGEVLENITPEGWINWDKHSKVAAHIWSVKRFMRARMIFRPVEVIQDYINSAEIWEGEKPLAAIAKLRDTMTVPVVPSMDGALSTNAKKQRFSKEKTNERLLKMTDRDWQLLHAGAVTKLYGASETILPMGVVNRHLFRIKKGSVRVDKRIGEKNVTVARMYEKEMFGEISMLLRADKGKTTAAIIADQETHILKYQVEFVLQMCRQEPYLSEKLNKILVLNLVKRLREFGSQPTDKKDAKDENEKDKKVHKISKEKEKHKDSKKGKKKSGDKDTSKKKPQHSVDDEFKKNFSLEPDEILVKKISCSMKISMTSQGSIMISPSYLCFEGFVFGRKIREKFKFNEIQNIQQNNKRIEIEVASKLVILKDFDSVEDSFSFINNFWETNRSKAKTFPKPDNLSASIISSSTNSSLSGSTSNSSLGQSTLSNNATESTIGSSDSEELSLAPTGKDWEMIVEEGARSMTFNKDEYVITQGQSRYRRLYQLASGSCRIEKDVGEGGIIVLGYITASDPIFGEISFLEGSPATASVVSADDDTSVNVIEGYYLDILFDYFPGLSGRFYHYLAQVLSTRLAIREGILSNNRAELKPSPTFTVISSANTMAASMSGEDGDDVSTHKKKNNNNEDNDNNDNKSVTSTTITSATTTTAIITTLGTSSEIPESTSTSEVIPSTFSGSTGILADSATDGNTTRDRAISGDKKKAQNKRQKSAKELGKKSFEGKIKKEREKKDHSKEDSDFKDHKDKDNDHKDKDHKEKDPKDKEHKDKDPKDKDHKEKDSKEKDPKDKEHKDKDHKEKDHKEKDPKDKDHKDKDPKDKDHKDGDHKEKGKDKKKKEKV